MEESLVPNTAHISESSQEQVIVFELVPDRSEENDPALINTLGREVTTQLQKEGFVVNSSVYSGQKGGFLVELVAAAQQMGATIWDNHAVIAEGIADISGLVTVFGGVLPVLKRVIGAHEEQVGKMESAARPIKMTVEIDGAVVVIEAAEVAQAEAPLKLALRYRALYPGEAGRVTAKSRMKVRGKVPGRKRRSRR